MGPFGILLLIGGVLLLVFGFSADVRAPGSNIVNLSLMQQQQLIIIVGVGVLVIGAIFTAIGASRSGKGSASAPAAPPISSQALALALSDKEQLRKDQQVAFAQARHVKDVIAERLANTRRPCPLCAEAILPAAKVCPHCRRDLPGDWSAAQSST